MIIDPEQVSLNLFSLLKAATWTINEQEQGFVFTERRPRLWSEVPAGNMPYMALTLVGISESQTTVGGNPICQVHYDCWIYLQVDTSHADGAPIPETIVNAVLGQYGKGPGFGIRSSLTPNFGENQDLSEFNNGAPFVVHCWIDGQILADTYVDENPAVLKIPISVLVGG